jgi:acyl dehydratase
MADKMLLQSNPRGLFFEEFEIGDEVVSPGRTITEADIVAFAGLSGDYNQLHTDAEFAAATPFGQRIAHGLLCLSIASGLASRLGFIEGTALAFRELTWKFSQPVFIGDTVHVKVRVAEKRPMPRLGGGMIVFDVALLNQEGAVVQRGQWRVIIKSRE